MDLLERYLQAVGQYLPQETREDVLAELRVNLLAEMDARVDEMERPLTESEAAAILKAHGRPMLVAARYLPQHYLIGPAGFPFYLLTLRKGVPLVVLIYFVARVATFVFSRSAGASAGFAPMWRLFYVTFIIVLLAQLGIKLMALARGNHRLEQPLELFTNLLGLLPVGLLAFNKVYFVPAGPAANLHALTQINYWTNVGFRIVLVIVVLNLLVESWQYLRRVVPAERLAF